MITVFFVVDSLKYFNTFFLYLTKPKNTIRHKLYVDAGTFILLLTCTQSDNAQRATTKLTIRYTDKTFLKSGSILFYTMVEKYKKIGKCVLYL